MTEEQKDLAREYLKAEADFTEAFKLMNYWKEEADRRNKIAGEALDVLQAARDKERQQS